MTRRKLADYSQEDIDWDYMEQFMEQFQESAQFSLAPSGLLLCKIFYRKK